MTAHPSLIYLGWTALLTMLLWIPYILERIRVQGLLNAVGYPDNPPPVSAWADRAQKAHYNAVENLAVFAPLVLASVIIGSANDATAAAAMAYFWARLVHYVVYTFKLPWLRTLSFFVAWLATLCVAWNVLV
ncbi:MAG: MAPEG family protein [Gammaproteobacteria bacterium]|nr:MAPEG family protein [Gammaproteobacteria bacterium]NIR96884.1 MAPEG family protein [Gammaproteobacteria bacterium]NIT64293.1 MAPEG family protein [Gammaproteobacteria bacterium]NIV19539.1 MAPEG family protein [Gammaproteobacteria bacterium]NIY32873.1 MAPEG family protein [Gammaproteobacteria bacterium]